MSYTATHYTSHTAQISVKPSFKSANSIKAAVRHNNRIGNEGSGPHIDERRKHLNQDLLGGQSQDEIYLNLINRLTGKQYTKANVPMYGEDEIRYADGRKIRSSKDRSDDRYDTVLAFELEMMYPGDLIWCRLDENGEVVPLPEDTVIDVAEIAAEGEILKDPNGNPILDANGNKIVGKGYFEWPLNDDEFEEWCRSSVEFARDRFGTENVVSALLHMDESTPHMHIMCTPVIVNADGQERLDYATMLGKEITFDRLQDEYSSAVAHIGYQRGERNSLRINQISTKEYKVRLSKQMSKEMPETLDEAKEMIRDLRVTVFDREERLKECKVSASKFQKTRNKLDLVEEENRQLKQQVQEQAKMIQAQLERLMLSENRRRCIEEGLLINGRQDVSEAFRQMELQYLNHGYNHLLALGYSEEQVRYWEDHSRLSGPDESIDLDHDEIGDGDGH